jgi:hypothetical protein
MQHFMFLRLPSDISACNGSRSAKMATGSGTQAAFYCVSELSLPDSLLEDVELIFGTLIKSPFEL